MGSSALPTPSPSGVPSGPAPKPKDEDLRAIDYDPQTGENIYRLNTPRGVQQYRLYSVEKSPYLPDAPREAFDHIEKRYRRLQKEFGQRIDPTFFLDIAGSTLPEDEMVRLTRQRLDYIGQGDPSMLSRIVGAATLPLRWSLKNTFTAFGLPKHYFFDKPAQWITGDHTMTIGKLGAAELGALTGDPTAKEYFDRMKSGKENFVPWDQFVEHKAGRGELDPNKAGWYALFGAMGDVALDPIIFLGKVKAIRTAARGIEAEGVAAKTGRLWERGRTTLSDVNRMLDGEVRLGDVAVGKASVSDWLKVHFVQDGAETTSWARTTRRLAEAPDAATIRRSFKALGHNVSIEQASVLHASARTGGVEGLRSTLLRLLDPAQFTTVMDEFAEAVEGAKRAADEIEQLTSTIEAASRPGATPDLRVDMARNNLRLLDQENKEMTHVLETAKVSSMTLHPLEAFPRERMSSRLEQAVKASKIGQAFVAPDANAIIRATRAMGKPAGRTLRGLVTMKPHAFLATEHVDDAVQQYERWLTGIELDTQKIRPLRKATGRKPDVVAWTRDHTRSAVAEFAAATDDIARRRIVEQTQERILSQHLGLNPEDIKYLVKQNQSSFNEAVRYIKANGTRVKKALFDSDLGDRIPLLPPGVVRDVAKKGRKVFTQEGTRTAALKEVAENLNRAWKTFAVAKPSWFTRVVMLSEQPRWALAGGPNIYSHPLLWLALRHPENAVGVTKLHTKLAQRFLRASVKFGMGREPAELAILASDLGHKVEDLGNLAIAIPNAKSAAYKASEMVSKNDRVAFAEGWVKGQNEILRSDSFQAHLRSNWLARARRTMKEDGTFVLPKDTDLRQAMSTWLRDDPAGQAYAQRHGIDVTKPLAAQQEIGERLEAFKHWTRENYDLVNRQGSLSVEDVYDGKDWRVEPPKELPFALWEGTLKRPKWSLEAPVMKRATAKVFEYLSRKPSYAWSRLPQYRYSYVSNLRHYFDFIDEGAASARVARKIGRKADIDTLQAMDMVTGAPKGAWRSYDDAEPMERAFLDKLNPTRKVDQPANLESLSKEIKEKGFDEPVIVEYDPENGVVRIADGFHRAEAARRLGLKQVPVRVKVSDLSGETIGRGTFSVKGKATEELGYIAPSEAFVEGLPRVQAKASFDNVMDYAAGKPVELNPMERRLHEAAHSQAVKRVKHVVYDLAESARAADLARFIMPFANAWQEEMTRWAMLAWARPHIPLTMQAMWRQRDAAPFTYKDPRNGEDIFMFPMGANIVKFATKGFGMITGGADGLAWPLIQPFQNMNIVTGNGFLPGGGPWIQIPAIAVQRHVPALRELMTVFNPYGGRSYLDALNANAVVRGIIRATSGERTQEYAMMQNAVLQQAWWEADGDVSKLNIKKIHDQTRALMWVNAIAGMTVGGGLRADLPPELQEIHQYARSINQNFDKQTVNLLLLERYGPKMGVWMTAYSKSLTGQPPTKEAEQFLLNKKSRAVAEKYGKRPAFWSVMSESVRGAFDPMTYYAQIARGDRQYRFGDEFYEASQNLVGWWRLSQINQARDRILLNSGLHRLSQKGAEGIKAWYDEQLGNLYAAYPAFREEHSKFSQREEGRAQNLRDLVAMSKDKFFDGIENIRVFKVYWGAREAMRQQMAALGFKSLSGQEAIPLKKVWLNTTNQILAQNPEFRYLYARLGLAFDDLKEVE